MLYIEWLNQKCVILAKSREAINVYCHYCNKSFAIKKHQIQSKAAKGYKELCCSRQCSNNCVALRCYTQTACGNCGKPIVRLNKEISASKSGFVFCSQTCSGTYNNTHKTHGTRRSKLEYWLEDKLKMRYPRLKIEFNSKTAIKSELDIYFPKLKLAFELNGIFHYEPIYGSNKLEQIQNNDNRKFQACLEQGIELCIIDTSSQKTINSKTCSKYLDIITQIVDAKRDLSDNIR